MSARARSLDPAARLANRATIAGPAVPAVTTARSPGRGWMARPGKADGRIRCHQRRGAIVGDGQCGCWSPAADRRRGREGARKLLATVLDLLTNEALGPLSDAIRRFSPAEVRWRFGPGPGVGRFESVRSRSAPQHVGKGQIRHFPPRCAPRCAPRLGSPRRGFSTSGTDLPQCRPRLPIRFWPRPALL